METAITGNARIVITNQMKAERLISVELRVEQWHDPETYSGNIWLHERDINGGLTSQRKVSKCDELEGQYGIQIIPREEEWLDGLKRQLAFQAKWFAQSVKESHRGYRDQSWEDFTNLNHLPIGMEQRYILEAEEKPYEYQVSASAFQTDEYLIQITDAETTPPAFVWDIVNEEEITLSTEQAQNIAKFLEDELYKH